MRSDSIVGSTGGLHFADGPDHGRVLISAAETDGAYSLMEWTIAPRSTDSHNDHRDFGPHRHDAIEEVFVVRKGSLDFLLHDEIVTMHAHDVVRVPPGVRHGYLNRSGADVKMLVSFVPGGFETLFLKYRSDQPTAPDPGFVEDAAQLFATEFEHQ
ncbi:MAG TPA: cupin domain-containing protein [Acidimicrobiia bacterium]